MTPEVKSIPKWILIVSEFFSLLGLIVSSTLIFSPQSELQMVDLNAKGVDYLIYMWAARQSAVGFIFGFATFKESIPMLTIAYILFLVMNIADWPYTKRQFTYHWCSSNVYDCFGNDLL